MASKKSIVGNKNFHSFKKEHLREISNVHLKRSNQLFQSKEKNTKSNNGKWQELVYCILAGTQFPVTKLKIIFKHLIDENVQLIDLKTFDEEEKLSNLASYLKKKGYRYHTQKAKSIINAASFFRENFESDINKFLSQYDNVIDIREDFVKGVNGVGIKIASHWLRNIGYGICTIDIHLRRFLVNLNISNENPETSLSKNNFLFLEAEFKTLSEILNIPLGNLQYSVWEYTRSNCAKYKCGGCPLRTQCKRGSEHDKRASQMDLFDG